MGLDITVHRLTKQPTKDWFTLKNSKEFIDHGFKSMIQRKTQSYYDIKQYFNNHNLKLSDYKYAGFAIRPDESYFKFQKIDLKLKRIHKNIQNRLVKKDPECNTSYTNYLFLDTSWKPLTVKELEYLTNLGFNKSIYREDPRCMKEHITPMKYDLWNLYEFITEYGKIKIDTKDIPWKEKVDKILYYTEVGYQRKGLNSQFYQDFEEGKIHYFVFTKAELEQYLDKYCNNKEDFQANIIDKFIEGTDVVSFDW